MPPAPSHLHIYYTPLPARHMSKDARRLKGFNDFDLFLTNKGTSGVEGNRITPIDPIDPLPKSVIDGRIVQCHARKVADYVPICKYDAESKIGLLG